MSGPGLSQIPFSTATRPTSWRSPARRSSSHASSPSPASPPAAPASPATRRECPRSHGDLRSAKSATAVSTASSRSGSTVATGSGSQASAASHSSSPGEAVADPRDGVDDRRVVGAPAPLRQPVARVQPQPARQVDVPRDGRDPDGERDRVAREPRRRPLPVPALVRMPQRVDDGRLEAGAGSEHGGDLAVDGQGIAAQVGEPPRHEPDAAKRGLAGADRAHEPPHCLAARAHDHGRHRSVEGAVVAPGRRGGLARVGGAAEEAQEREPVHGADLVRARSRAPPRARPRARTSAARGPAAGPCPGRWRARPTRAARRAGTGRPAPIVAKWCPSRRDQDRGVSHTVWTDPSRDTPRRRPMSSREDARLRDGANDEGGRLHG